MVSRPAFRPRYGGHQRDAEAGAGRCIRPGDDTDRDLEARGEALPPVRPYGLAHLLGTYRAPPVNGGPRSWRNDAATPSITAPQTYVWDPSTEADSSPTSGPTTGTGVHLSILRVG